jgi:SAM-dependent methyltransferase
MAEERAALAAMAPAPSGHPNRSPPGAGAPASPPSGAPPRGRGRSLTEKLLSRLRPGRPLLIAERFRSPAARLSRVVLPLDVVARAKPGRLRIVILEAGDPTPSGRGAADFRVATLSPLDLSPDESLRLDFAPFDAPAGASFLLGVLDLAAETEAPLAADLRALRAEASARPPIHLECGGGSARAGEGYLADERAIAVYRLPPGGRPRGSEEGRSGPRPAGEGERVSIDSGRSGVDVAYWLDSFWCDPHGIYLRGWVHAHQHRVLALTVESGGRSVRFEAFTDRPDLLKHYPDHEHVRHAGFAVYLPCPPGQPVRWTLETEGGPARLPLPLPEGPLPPWPAAPDDDGNDEVSPMLRRFVDLVNARGGRVLQIGARTPAELAGMPPRSLLRGPVVGLDIHPGHCVDLVGDAHFLSHFLRSGSFDAVVSGSVLEHLQAPWLFAAEVNRVIKPGGLVYHEAPGAWSAHAQPNDFWRMSADGLQALFGAECGFEVLEARDAGPMAMIPGPRWRQRHLDMPTVPAYAMAEILARKVGEIEPGAVAWPLGSGESAGRSRLYPVDGLRLAQPRREVPP